MNPPLQTPWESYKERRDKKKKRKREKKQNSERPIAIL